MTTDPENPPQRWSELRVLRLCAQMTQAQIGEAVGAHQTLVAMWERGARTVPAQREAQIAVALGVPAEVLRRGAIGTPLFRSWANELADKAFAAAQANYVDALISEAVAA